MGKCKKVTEYSLYVSCGKDICCYSCGESNKCLNVCSLSDQGYMCSSYEETTEGQNAQEWGYLW